MSFFKRTITRAQAVADDAAARKEAKSLEAAWQDWYTVALALGWQLPEKRLTAAEKRRLKKQADKIINRELRRLLDGEPLDFNMKILLHDWVKQRERGPGRPTVQKGPIIKALSMEKRKSPHLNRKRLLGAVGDRAGVGMERMKQLAPPSGVAEMNRIVKRSAGA